MKPVKPVDRKFQRDKKLDRIRGAVTYVFAALWFVAIFIMGLGQNDDALVGTALIIMGVISIAYSAFLYTVTFRLHWNVLGLWDGASVREKTHLHKDLIAKEREKNRAGFFAATAVFLVFGIACTVLGILRLIG